MARPVVGWESESPVPNHTFNDYLSSRGGRLFLEDLDLASLFLGQPGTTEPAPGFDRLLPSPLEIVYMPIIHRQIWRMEKLFAEVIEELGYQGRFYYAYASKANAAEEVVRTTLSAGAHHEMSSTADVDIMLVMIERGLLPEDRLVICNGFKPEGTAYAKNILRLKAAHDNLIPVLEDFNEFPPLLNSGFSFDVGLRQKSYGHHKDQLEMDGHNSRFGFDTESIWKAADVVASSPSLRLKIYHAMVGSQILDEEDFISWLKPPMELYAQLRKEHPSLAIFDFGGGMPVPMTLDFSFDYREFIRRLLTALKEICGAQGVPEPDVMGEFGRYTTSEHGAHLFKIIAVKENNSKLPWYLIDGSIMSSFPDSWALSEHFIVLPLTNLDSPFRRVQLGGMTCDSDDVYPPKPSKSPLYLPANTDDLYIGFFSIGAYQEMLGGVRGSKHCVLPEAYELLVDRGNDGQYNFDLIVGQTVDDVLRNLGYQRA